MSGSAGIYLGTNGVNPDRKSSRTERFGLNDEAGRYTQIRITNTQGQLVIRSISVEAMKSGVREGSSENE